MSSAVHKWGTEIHEGIYNMLMLLVDLVAERVKQDPIPIGLMGVLTMVSREVLFSYDADGESSVLISHQNHILTI